MPERISRADLLGELRRVASELGGPPRMAEFDAVGEYSAAVYSRRFDGWAAALAAADLEEPDAATAAVSCPDCGTRQRITSARERFVCTGCGASSAFWRGHLAGLAASEVIAALAEGPRTWAELPRGPEGAERSFVRRLDAPASSSRNKPRGGTRNVYFLFGDERRAVERFADLNGSYVASCVADGSNPLRRNWDDDVYQLLLQQWYWGDHDRPPAGEG